MATGTTTAGRISRCCALTATARPTPGAAGTRPLRVPHRPKWLHPLWMPPAVESVSATPDRGSPLLRTLERLRRLPDDPGTVVGETGARDHTAAAVRER